ncbi:hypothetical protein GCM10010276_22780 [Streptomyces longisporus]|uniref:Uncharacterized protein n=1 Tax=Streptomyces longisporus TaxID=1948 RepID=A0ABN3LHV1_STRLO
MMLRHPDGLEAKALCLDRHVEVFLEELPVIDLVPALVLKTGRDTYMHHSLLLIGLPDRTPRSTAPF